MKPIHILALGIAILTVSCSGEAPEIVHVRPQLHHVDDRSLGERYERLQIYVLAEDRNGIEDVELLYIIHDESDSYWRLNSDNWNVVERDGLVWLGSSGLVMEHHRPFPRGEYRLSIIDASGEGSEESFLLTTEELLAESLFPGLLHVEPNVIVDGDWPRVTIRAYTLQGTQIGEYKGPGGSIPTRQLTDDGRQPAGLEFWVYVSRPDQPLLVSGPYRF